VRKAYDIRGEERGGEGLTRYRAESAVEEELFSI
jgi:hypothetical protein